MAAGYPASGFAATPRRRRSSALASPSVTQINIFISGVLASQVAGALYPLLLFASGGVTLGEAKALLRRRRGLAAKPDAG